MGRCIAMVYTRFLLSLAVVSVVSASNAFNLAQDFSVANGNPNGVWSYGYKLAGDTGAPLVLFDQVDANPASPWWGHDFGLGAPAIWRNLTGSVSYGVPLGATSLHPGSANQLATARFTVPVAGTLHLEGAFGNGDGGNVDVFVAHNATLLLSVMNIPGAQGFAFDRAVAAGDTIDFMVGDAGSFFYDNTPIDVEIGIVPEPASLVILVAGLAAVARRRR